jgi:hypothetical protein
MKFYPMVPKPLEANLFYRRKVLEAAYDDPDMALDLKHMCAQDPLFFLNVFGWTYDSRIVAHPELPFVTYPYQDEVLLELLAAAGFVDGVKPHDIALDKSRDGGASWLCVVADVWSWLFSDMVSFLWVSRKEDLVDKPQDPKCLFWKADYLLGQLPAWLRPPLVRTHLHLFNAQTQSTIDGESTTGDVSRGDRRTRILLDEFASFEDGFAALAATADSTDCRTFNSTTKGTGVAFYAVKTNPAIKKLRLHWSQHPRKNPGLYTSKDGVLELLDKPYGFPQGYPFILDGKVRSPWYDAECIRRASPLEVAQELDGDDQAAGSPFFDIPVLTRLRQETVRPPLSRGELHFDATGRPDKFVESPGGLLLLWTPLLAPDLRPAQDRPYCLGIDVSAGAGASNSCISVGDASTGRKVAELATPHAAPDQLAVYAVALGRWFGGIIIDDNLQLEAFMAWEGGGPGDIFAIRVLFFGYHNVFYRTDDQDVTHKVGTKPGWFSTLDTKQTLLGEYRRALAANDFINPSLQAITEAGEYVFLQNGGVGHAREGTTADPSGARKQHGDRVIADALCWRGMQQQPKNVVPKTRILQGSFAHRRLLRQQAVANSREY